MGFAGAKEFDQNLLEGTGPGVQKSMWRLAFQPDCYVLDEPRI